jgi:predicted peroxiredoxin
MSKMLFVGTHGTDDPTLATFPFELAVGAAQEGHEARIALLAEAVVLMKDPVVSELHGFGCPPFEEVLAQVVEHRIPVYV